MQNTRIKLSTVLENLLPNYVKESFPLVIEFLKEYYRSLESKGSTLDVLQNLDKYINLDNITNQNEEIFLAEDVNSFETEIEITLEGGFTLPNSYGLIQIDDEIILYRGKKYLGNNVHRLISCVRGFSGITNFQPSENIDYLEFKSSETQSHRIFSPVKNLSNLIFSEFFVKLKKQFAPGFEDNLLYKDLNQNLFIKQLKDFYSSKGTDESFRILFKALYGEKVEVIKPQDYLFIPSNSEYRISRNLVVERISGDIESLEGKTIYQDKSDVSDIAYATVNRVQLIERNNKKYYILSLDYDYDKDINLRGSVFGQFEIGPKTTVTEKCIIGSRSIFVDSTLGFPKGKNFGVENSSLFFVTKNGLEYTIEYESLTNNQFLFLQYLPGLPVDIEPGTEIFYNNFCYSGNSKEIKFRITGVLSDIEIEENFGMAKDGTIRIKTLGKSDPNDQKSNSWIFNLPVTYDVKALSLSSSFQNNYTYSVELFDKNILRSGDFIELLTSDPKSYEINSPINVTGEYTFTFTINESLNTNLSFRVKRKISKCKLFIDSKESSFNNIYASEVQNVYYGKKDGEIYVASNGLPNYNNDTLNLKSYLVNLTSGSFISQVSNSLNPQIIDTILNFGDQNPHPFLTGDEVFYTQSNEGAKLNLEENIPYYIKRISDTEVKLAYTRSNIFTETFIDLSIIPLNDDFDLGLGNIISRFFTRPQSFPIESKDILKKIENPEPQIKKVLTKPGSTGIFINGVELLNYKSYDKIYYNSINSISVVNSGINYDVINPPYLQISDKNGEKCESHLNISGSLSEIQIINSGFDFTEEPTIRISGGNGSGAVAKAILEPYEYSVSFNAGEISNTIDLISGTIGFSTYHKLIDGEEVLFEVPEGSEGIPSLIQNTKYYVGVIDELNVRLYNTFLDSSNKVNQITFTTYGSGVNSLRCLREKFKLGGVEVISGGFNYSNKKVLVDPVGINTFSNIIKCPDRHNFSQNDKIVYSYTETQIIGLTTSSTYYVNIIDDFTFSISSDLNSSPVRLLTTGIGTHIFKYEPIKVEILGTDRDNNNLIDIKPIFKGKINSVYVYNKGRNYGSSDILNYNRQPEYSILNGEGAQLTPIISNGKIVKVIINNPGKNYFSTPEIIITGNGSQSKLIPILRNNKIIDVIISKSGIGYDSDKTFLTVKSSGSGASLSFNIQEWNINEVQRYLLSSGNTGSAKVIDDNDCFVVPEGSRYKIRLKHAYAPRKLREFLVTKRNQGNEFVYSKDLVRRLGVEVDSITHSPIIGWAYDGNPIYGPYGFENKDGSGQIKKMLSGYKLIENEDRPNFPQGFFVEDYQYIGQETNSEFDINIDSVLDEHNGRFCITPEYPQGVYAYFCTVGDISSDFENYKIPIFPYVIGNTYYSKPIDFNFNVRNNQVNIDINRQEWIRNTYPYNLNSVYSEYEFLDVRPNNESLGKILSTQSGTIDDIEIVAPGFDYNVGDKLIFNNENTGGKNSYAVVSEVEGKQVSEIFIDEDKNFSNLDFYLIPNQNSSGFIGITSVPHKLTEFAQVILYGIKKFIPNEKNDFITKIVDRRSNRLIVLNEINSIANSGIVTYFNVSGNLNFPFIKENDVYLLSESEKVKILNVDKKLSRVRVLRNYQGASDPDVENQVFSSGRIIYNDSNTFEFLSQVNINENYEIPRQYYFDPNESLGIGTQYGIQYGKNIIFSNPGTGSTQVFVQSQRIYLPDHGIKNGSKLVYSSQGFNPISISTDGITSQFLQEGDVLYATVFSKDIIGISTLPVGISTNIEFDYSSSNNQSGLLYFTGTGSGLYHSFKTQVNTQNRGKLSTSLATISLEEEHEMGLGENVRLEVLSGITTSHKVLFNTKNRRIIFDPKYFTSLDVDIELNTITIQNHKYYTGQKVIYNSPNSSNLINDEIYYVIVVDKNTVKLSDSLENSILINPIAINISNAVDGSLSAINPKIEFTRNQEIIFDLSDFSLSFNRNNQLYSAFRLNFYTDKDFTQLLVNSNNFKNLNINRTGQVGITSTANVSIKINDNWPNLVYYKFDFDNLSIISNDKKELVVDTDVRDYNQISIVNSVYSGIHQIVGIGSTTFNIFIENEPESLRYTNNNSSINLFTRTTLEKGKISKIDIIEPGYGYKFLPSVSSFSSRISDFESSTGSGSIVFPRSKTIGKIRKFEIKNIGSDYYSDLTLRPTGKLPENLKLEPFNSIDEIKILYPGKNYIVSPRLLIFDGLTDVLDENIILDYELGDQNVKVIKNSNGLYNKTPRIVPINNTNGIGIREITYDSLNKEATVYLSVGFSVNSDPFPFGIGEKIIIENVNVGIGTINSDGNYEFIESGKGYNSSDYNYKLFTITEIDENYGGFGSIKFKMDDFISEGQNPGIFNANLSQSAIVVPEKYLPNFEITLKKNQFLLGETVVSPSAIGIVERWDSNIDTLTVSTIDDFKIDDIVQGKTTYSTAKIVRVDAFDVKYVVSGSAVVNEGWQDESGFLNNSRQRTPNNDYYQYFSYSLKSKKQYSEWSDYVDKLNHIAGFKKFGDLIVESTLDLNQNSGIATEAVFSDVSLSTDFIETVDFNCYNYFDYVTENAYYFGDLLVSDEITLKNIEIQDYIESVGNRVLLIDDISPQFDNSPRLTPYSIVDSFNFYDENIGYRKYFAYVKDKTFNLDRQFSIISLLPSINNSLINQYGTIDSYYILGNFDCSNNGPEINLEFYPNNYQINDYDIHLLSFSLVDEISNGILGNDDDILKIQTNTEIVNSGIGSTTISLIGISSSVRTSKLMISLKNDDYSIVEFVELTIVRDDNDNFSILEYGHLSNNLNSILGIGTYSSYYDNISNKIIVEVESNVSLAFTGSITSTAISLDSIGIASSEIVIDNSKIFSAYEKILSSPFPGITTISSYSSSYKGSYHIVSVADTIGNRHQTSEIVLLNSASETGPECFISEFGIVQTSENLCSLGATIIGNEVNLEIIPVENTALEVRTFSIALKESNPLIQQNKIDIGSSYLKTSNSEYFGTEKEIRKEFDLYHNDIPIFEKVFNAELSSIVNIDENKFDIISHYFTTGEEIVYNPNGGLPIGIATTSIAGIGITDKLPTNLYVVKIDETSFQVASSVEDALNPSPKLLEIQSVGVGTAHKFATTKQINKTLISIDNVIQTPIVVSTSSTTVLSANVKLKDVRIFVDDTTNFASGDYIKINDEILKIKSVGFGSTNALLTERKSLGTGIATHNSGSVIKKITGNYNVVNNKIFFTEAPYGKIPESNSSDSLDDIDWSGITTSSTFHGRVFLRSSKPNVIEETYTKNYIFDNISDQFNGTEDEFALKIGGQNVTGISTSNVLVSLKDILQIPQKTDVFDPRGNYKLVGTSQTTFITFDKSGTIETPTDVNVSNIPVGGVIVSVSSKGGFGYQTLVSAGATPIVSSSGTIQSLVIGNFGSGYRKSPSYQIISSVSQNISVGSTIIYLNNEDSLFQKLNYASNSTISIGSSIKNIPIVGYTTNSILIGAASTLNSSILESTTAVINLNNTKSSLINIGISTYESEKVYHLGFTTSVGGYISSNVFITNPGISYTNFPLKYETTTTSLVSAGSTIIPISIINDVSIGDYIGIGTLLPLTRITGIGETFINISTASTVSYQINSNQNVQVKINKLPLITFEDPLPYSNIPLVYSQNSPNRVGFGTNAYANIVIGEGRVEDFEIINSGYGYKKGDILTISTNSDDLLGISTDQSKSFTQLEFIVDQVYEDKFSAWSIGDIDILDSFEDLFDGETRTFPLKLNGDVVALRARKGSLIDIQSTLIIILNDVLQVPGISYEFNGGSVVTFTEAPRFGDKVHILFYKGTSEVDIQEVDILETIKVGDDIFITSDDPNLNQSKRVVYSIVSSDRFYTNIYNRNGINPSAERSLTWCKQTEDKIINGIKVLKSRDSYEPSIYQTARLIQSVGINSLEIFVDSVKNLFDSPLENTSTKYQNKIKIISQSGLISASATCNVSSSGTITSFNINNFGSGYDESPEITIQNPIGLGSTFRASASALVSNGKIISISVENAGTGYNLGPVSSLKLTSQGQGFPTGIDPLKQNNTFFGAKLKSLSGNGKGAVVDLSIDKNNIVSSVQIINSGNGYSVGDIVFIDTFINDNLKESDRNTILSTSIQFVVESISSPEILISSPKPKFEIINNVDYEGDYGDIVGFGSTGSLFYMDLHIPYTSSLRKSSSVGSGITLSGIQTNYYLVVTNSNLGNGSISLRNDNSLIGIGTTCLDNIYQVYDVSVFESDFPGIGVTYITRIKTKVQDLSKVQFPIIQTFDNNNTTMDSTNYTFDNIGLETRKYGEYSWGKITADVRKNPKEFEAQTYNAISGLSTTPIVQRFNPLRYKNYIQ